MTSTDTAVLSHREDGSSGADGDGPKGDLETEISIRGLTKSFGSQTVLEDITCDIPKGKVTLMLGPSGTGKSVFLKNIMGLLKPESGEIWIDGRDIVKLGSRDLYKVRRKFGVLFQDGALFGSMNIYDNVAFPLREHPEARAGDQGHRRREAEDGRAAARREEAPRRDLGRHEEAGRAGPGPRSETLRVDVEMVETSDGWKVSSVDILQSPGGPLGSG